MLLSNHNYEIQITKDGQYTLFSTDNIFYDIIIETEEYSRNDFICAYSVSIQDSLHDNDYKVGIIGRAYGSVENCAVLEENRLVVLADNYLVFFDLKAQQLENKILILDFGTGIEIYPFDEGYIVNGETDIIKVDKFGNKVWDFSGRDIWVRPNGESSIKILDNSLLLIDWEGNKYNLDKLGREISCRGAGEK